MSKKSFKDNPAMAFISHKNETTQQEAQNVKYEKTQEYTQYNTQQDISITKQLPREGYIRTQGRKGHKKPRINLAFDSDDLLNKVRMQAEKEGKSITQLMNEAILIYLRNIK